jgi:forkhead transcription factor HCM1
MPMAPPMTKCRATDSLQKKPLMSRFKTGPQKPSFEHGIMAFDKENMNMNMHTNIFPAPSPIDLSIPNYYHKPNGKRALMEAPLIKEGRPAKRTKPDEQTLPSPDSFPAIVDDGTKPQHSYAQLIGMAILRAPNRRLTLAQIYKWISSNFKFYNIAESGWQNSIRHNLSLHKNFLKIERPKDDPGKGNYWTIEPGTELQFLKEKSTRKTVPTAENLPVMSTRLEPSRPNSMMMPEPTLPPPGPAPVRHTTLPPLPTSQATMSVLADLSSDATILVSDGAAPEDSTDKNGEDDLPIESSAYSPLPGTMHSSPPVPRRSNHRSGTPPPASHHPTSSVSRSHRKFASMDDSGYISSLESSVMRPNPKAVLLTSEPDRPRIKRGRAEEEIARLRNSSPFSPTHARSHSTYGPVSSSPMRPPRETQMLAPFTPIFKAKPAMRPPPSNSPNTNLRMHRERMSSMLQSPLRKVSGADDPEPWSPTFRLEDQLYGLSENQPEFSLYPVSDFNDFFASMTSAQENGSPIKGSAKRGRLDRSLSTSVLNEINNSPTKRTTVSAPLLKVPEQPVMTEYDTPSKVFDGDLSPSKFFQSPIRATSPIKFATDLAGLSAESTWEPFMDPNDFLSAGNLTDVGGLDMLQGFAKIGSGSESTTQSGRGSKPGLERSYTTNF